MNEVKLVSYSQPPAMNGREFENLQDMIEYVARVSNPSCQKVPKEPGRLIRYLVRNKHWSPFEMVSIVLEVNTTRDIARQLLRHRSFSFQEFSQRYADPTKDLDFTIRDARLQDEKNRQNSIDAASEQVKKDWVFIQEQVIHEAKLAYAWARREENNIAKEQARSVLPEGCTNSRLYVSGTLRSWMHYVGERTKPGTQLEHRELANNCATAIWPVFPMIEDFVYHARPLEDCYYEIVEEASVRMRKATSGARGQTITMFDDLCYWVMEVTKEWKEEGKIQ